MNARVVSCGYCLGQKVRKYYLNQKLTGPISYHSVTNLKLFCLGFMADLIVALYHLIENFAKE